MQSHLLPTLFFRGNPDKCDLLGNTALHCAAANGHMHVTSFLVSFGANLWALDNDLHTPLDVGVLNNHTDIVRFLDEMAAQQAGLNRKVVRKMKEKSVLDAHKRIKKYEKLQVKAQKKAEKDEKMMAKERQKMQTGRLIEDNIVGGQMMLNGNHLNGVVSMQQNGNTLNRNGGTLPKKPGSGRTVSRSASVVGSHGMDEPKPFSAYVNNNTAKKPSVLTGVAKRIKQQKKHHNDPNSGEFKIGEVEMDGKRTIRSLSGLQRDHHIMYVRNNSHNETRQTNGHTESDTISRALSEPDFNYSNGSIVESSTSIGPTEAASMFERPGFGNVAFINRKITSGALMSLPSESTDIDSVSVVTNGVAYDSGEPGVTVTSRVRRRGSLTDSIGTVGSLAARVRRLPWTEDELEDDDTESTPLELFLSAHWLTDYLQVLTREQVDLSALMLMSDLDLKELGVPMGPRRKLLDAIARRKRTLSNPGIIMDTLL